jgi:hypothetical protein
MEIFSWKRIFKIVGVIVLAGMIIAGAYLIVNLRPVKIAWASLFYDSRENFLDCENLPFYPLVQKAFAGHADVVSKIKAVPGVANFYPEQNRCKILEGGSEFFKGQAVLVYKSRKARSQAENIIGKDFFGIPYRGQPAK